MAIKKAIIEYIIFISTYIWSKLYMEYIISFNIII